MAVFRKLKRKKGVGFQAVIRLKGYNIIRTFDRSEDARRWATDVEAGIMNNSVNRPFVLTDWMPSQPLEFFPSEIVQDDGGDVQPLALVMSPEPSPSWLLSWALEHYDSTVVDEHEGWRQERARIQFLRKLDIGQIALSDLTADHISQFLNDRSKGRGFNKPVGPSTIRNDVSRISILYKHAVLARRKGGWGLVGLVNPCSDVMLPKLPPARESRLDTRGIGDEVRVLQALADGLDGGQMVAIVTLAIDTGMRRSEILGLQAHEYRETEDGPEIRKLKTKNGKARTILLNDRATKALKAVLDLHPKGKLFTISADDVATRWDIARSKCGLERFTFHDLRHEGVSRMAESGLTLAEVMSQSGHSSTASVARYLHARPSEIRRKLLESEKSKRDSERKKKGASNRVKRIFVWKVV